MAAVSINGLKVSEWLKESTGHLSTYAVYSRINTGT